MIRWLLIALFIYIIIRLIRGPKKKRKSSIRFRFGGFNNQTNNNGSNHSRRPRLDEIEDAEFEDITDTDKAKKEDNS